MTAVETTRSLIDYSLARRAVLAALFGGERVLAGIGAGWNREEFEALGMEFPPLAGRMDRLEEAAILARALFDEGFGELAGQHVTACELSLGPPPSPAPRPRP